jgi:type II secretory pathway pseudopilin PulG
MRGQSGMTLLEALIATMMLAVISLTVFSAFAIGVRAALLAARMNTAAGLAEEALASLTALPCGTSFSAAPAAQDGAASGYAREAGARRVSAQGLWELHSTVSWTQGRQPRTVTLVTKRHVSSACRWAAP